ncbi:MAG: hypothetical protein INR71_12970 [Terriglobus roseus]|nr:hypothetical protein [Terriglobus roseus]
MERAYADAGEPYARATAANKASAAAKKAKGRRKSKAGGPATNGSAEHSLFEATVVPKNEGVPDGRYVIQVTDHRHDGTGDIAEPKVREIECLLCKERIE